MADQFLVAGSQNLGRGSDIQKIRFNPCPAE